MYLLVNLLVSGNAAPCLGRVGVVGLKSGRRHIRQMGFLGSISHLRQTAPLLNLRLSLLATISVSTRRRPQDSSPRLAATGRGNCCLLAQRQQQVSANRGGAKNYASGTSCRRSMLLRLFSFVQCGFAAKAFFSRNGQALLLGLRRELHLVCEAKELQRKSKATQRLRTRNNALTQRDTTSPASH